MAIGGASQGVSAAWGFGVKQPSVSEGSCADDRMKNQRSVRQRRSGQLLKSLRPSGQREGTKEWGATTPPCYHTPPGQNLTAIWNHIHKRVGALENMRPFWKREARVMLMTLWLCLDAFPPNYHSWHHPLPDPARSQLNRASEKEAAFRLHTDQGDGNGPKLGRSWLHFLVKGHGTLRTLHLVEKNKFPSSKIFQYFFVRHLAITICPTLRTVLIKLGSEMTSVGHSGSCS